MAEQLWHWVLWSTCKLLFDLAFPEFYMISALPRSLAMGPADLLSLVAHAQNWNENGGGAALLLLVLLGAAGAPSPDIQSIDQESEATKSKQ